MAAPEDKILFIGIVILILRIILFAASIKIFWQLVGQFSIISMMVEKIVWEADKLLEEFESKNNLSRVLTKLASSKFRILRKKDPHEKHPYSRIFGSSDRMHLKQRLWNKDWRLELSRSRRDRSDILSSTEAVASLM